MLRFTILSLAIVLLSFNQIASQGNIKYTIPLSIAKPGEIFSINDIEKNYQMVPMSERFSDPPGTWFYQNALTISQFNVTNFNFKDDDLSYKFYNENNVTYTANTNAIMANISFAWRYGNNILSIGRSNGTGVARINEFQFGFEFKKSNTSRLELALTLKKFKLQSINITYGFQTDEEKQHLQKAKNLMNNSTAAFDSYIFSQLNQTFFGKYQVANDNLNWTQSRLANLTEQMNYQLTKGPLIQNESLVFEFSGYVNDTKIEALKVENENVNYRSRKFLEPITQQQQRELGQADSDQTCMNFKTPLIDSIISNSVAFYSPLFYFNQTLIQKYPQVASYSPFYLFQGIEIAMWGADVWSYFAEQMGKNLTDTSLIYNKLDFQCYNSNAKKLTVSVNNIPKAKTDFLNYGTGQLSLGCQVRGQNQTDSKWVQLFGMRATLQFDMNIRYQPYQGDQSNRLMGSAQNFRLISLKQLVGGKVLDQKMLMQKLTRIIESISMYSVQALADGIKGLPLVKDSVSMAVDKTEGLKICGDMKFDIWKMK